MNKLTARLCNEEAGQDLVEYAILIALLALAAVATLGTLSNTIKSVFSNAAKNMASST
ncbi:MAG TPA: Flp family type IVb pilin [Terriglobia bacterium]|nr:Flp family type IVb pilin [Terriglobia bacterium]